MPTSDTTPPSHFIRDIIAADRRQIQARLYLWGTFVWNMFDFASDGRSEGDTHGRNDKGLVTYDRAIRKDAFYWYKANWTTTPFVYVTSRRWTDRTVATTTVKVYGTADSVRLTLNGVPVGSAQTSRCLTRFHVVYLLAVYGAALRRPSSTSQTVATGSR